MIRTRLGKRLIAAMGLGVLVGCSTSAPPIVGPTPKPASILSEKQAVTIAQQVAGQQINLALYQQPSASFDGRVWSIFFQEKPPGRPGGHFSIEVDDASKKTAFSPGE